MTKYHFTPNSYIQGCPLIYWANFNYACYEDIIVFLLKNGANPNHQTHRVEHDAYESTALHAMLASELTERAIRFINYASDPKILKTPLDPTVQDVEGKTTLIMGALLRNTKIVNLCLSRFGTAAIDLQDITGRTALHYAYLFGQSKMIKVLCQYGADQTIVDIDGLTPKEMLRQTEKIRRTLLRFHIDPERSNDFTYDKCINVRHIDRSTMYNTTSDTIYKNCIKNRIAFIQQNPDLAENTVVMSMQL